MREIEFRGKRADNGKWVYGSLINKFDADALCVSSSYIIERSAFSISADSDTTLYDVACLDDYHEVDEATVCQFSGLKDKNGVKVYEGDIIKFDEKEWGCEYYEVVKWDYELLDLRKNDYKQWCVVVGNVWDNPELIKEGE